MILQMLLKIVNILTQICKMLCKMLLPRDLLNTLYLFKKLNALSVLPSNTLNWVYWVILNKVYSSKMSLVFMIYFASIKNNKMENLTKRKCLSHKNGLIDNDPNKITKLLRSLNKK